ncbi:hypothetical protein FGO68_gene15522 [Halteria grandinella]|uniref:Uncharacterized protein n=1 Tax=Halteria grandinella TaxID=5974 RepID=A0A8J8NA67_HALGN|nr:hypothetical protein FGO68_gene15522 [Halteria grandinella]
MQPHYFLYNIERGQQIEFSTTRPGMLSKLYLIWTLKRSLSYSQARWHSLSVLNFTYTSAGVYFKQTYLLEFHTIQPN